jgi:hypothetical protein
MSAKRLVLAICTALFLFAQFWSFASAATLLSNIDNDPSNDICLEDVVSVDPFVGGSGNQSSVARGGDHFVPAHLLFLPALFVFSYLLVCQSPTNLASTFPLHDFSRPHQPGMRDLIGKLQV